MFFEGLRHFYIKSFCLVTTVCTVDFEILNCFAAFLTVALFSIIYSASKITRLDIYSFKTVLASRMLLIFYLYVT